MAKKETTTATATAAPAAPFVPKIAKVVTLPLSKFKVDVPKYVQFEGAIFTGKPVKAKDGEAEEKPADLANVIDLETGEPCQIIVGSVLRGILEDNYPDAGYIGHRFQIIQHAQREGKRYKTYTVNELE